MSEHAVTQPQRANTPQEARQDKGLSQRRYMNQPEPTILREQLLDAASGSFVEPRFGYDFSRVAALTGMKRQNQPLLRTQPGIQRFPKEEASVYSSCPECTETESPRRSEAAEPTVEGTEPALETAPTPAEAEPTAEETAPEETASPGLIVEDSAETVRPGQMNKSEFLSQLRAEVCRTVEEALAGTGQTTENCPYLNHWFDFYSRKDSAHIERTIHRYAPDASNATTASGYIFVIAQRARQAAETWVRTGEVTGVPEGVPTTVPGETPAESDESATAPTSPVMFKAREGGARTVDNPQAIQAELGEGNPLDGGVRSRMESAFGMDFSHVRTHTDTIAAGLSKRLNARAFTIGKHVAFGSGEYRPGTPVGDALIAHEMAHVVQQSGTSDLVAPRQQMIESGHNMLEEDADKSAIGAIASLWTGTTDTLSDIAQNAIPSLRSGLRLQRCQKSASSVALTYSTVAPKTNLGCGGFRWGVKWGLTKTDASTNGFVVQKLTFDLKREKCAGGRNDFAKIYWEAWQVRKGKIYIGTSKSLHNADTFQVPPAPSQKGVNFEEGRAKYIDGYTAPLSWGHVPEALSLPSTTAKPAGWSDSGTTQRWLKNEFDCCAGKTKSKLTSKG